MPENFAFFLSFRHCSSDYSCDVCSSFKKECPAKFTLAAQKGDDCQLLAVVSKSIIHNHPLDPEMYKMYPSVRRLDHEERQQQEELVSWTQNRVKVGK